MSGALPNATPGRTRLLGPVFRLPSVLILAGLRLYQRAISPLMPVVTLGGCACRFTPTCSHYAVDAVRTHGAFVGTWLAARRLVKCTPLHAGGFDPVPPVRSRPACRSVRNRNGAAPASHAEQDTRATFA